jgi:hypothetical protein
LGSPFAIACAARRIRFERADEVDVDRALEAGERVRPFLADDPFGVHDARAVDEPCNPPNASTAVADRRRRARLVGDVAAHEARAVAELLRERAAHRLP